MKLVKENDSSIHVLDLPMEIRLLIVSYTNISSSGHVFNLSLEDMKEAACLRLQRECRKKITCRLKVGDYVCIHRRGRWVGIGVVDSVSKHEQTDMFRVRLQRRSYTHFIYLYPRSDVDASYSYFKIKATDPIFQVGEKIHN